MSFGSWLYGLDLSIKRPMPACATSSCDMKVKEVILYKYLVLYPVETAHLVAGESRPSSVPAPDRLSLHPLAHTHGYS